MADNESSNIDNTSESDDSIDSSLAGLRLKTQREEMKMTIDEVASNLNLDVCYILAIETNDYSKISSTSYIYGYIRSYAKLLKLPEQEILDLYQNNKDDAPQLLPDYMGQKKVFADSSSKYSSLGVIIVVVAILLFITWWFVRQ